MKSIRFDIAMKDKKIIIGLFIISFLGACSSPTAMIGPVYTFSSTGSGLQAGINYGSDRLIRQYTGKSPMENLQKISSDQNNKTENIQKKTLESEDFYFLVKNKIEKTNKIIKISNQ
jgi:hypothetical protein